METRQLAMLRVLRLLAVKEGEYSGGERLGNFRRLSRALGLPMATVWAVYYAKHHDAILGYISDAQHGRDRPRSESIQGRIDDAIAYLLLLHEILEAEHRGKTPSDAPERG